LVAVDPGGMLTIKLGQPASRGDDIDPTVKDKLSGVSLRWIPQRGDLPVVSQLVEVFGSFTVWDACGFSHGVSWSENYVEAFWMWGGQVHRTLDNHKMRPAKPAKWLELETGRSFQRRGVRLKFGDRLVEGWRFYQEAQFKAVNGNYNMPAPGSGLGSTRNDFEITDAYTDNVIPLPRRPNAAFNRALYPGQDALIPRVFPPPFTRGRIAQAHDTWRASYTEGDTSVINVYRTSGYTIR